MDKELQGRIRKANKMMVIEEPEGSQEPAEAPQTAEPIDYYQNSRDEAYTASQRPTTYGSPAQMTTIVEQMAEDFETKSYKAAKNKYDHLNAMGMKGDADRYRQEYLVTEFLPFVESLVETYGVDALTNNQEVLEELDELVITTNGDGDGFTKSYLKQMHMGQGASPSKSDVETAYQLEKAEYMADNGDVRGGVELAKRIKERVDKGELSASEDDYSKLAKVSVW